MNRLAVNRNLYETKKLGHKGDCIASTPCVLLFHLRDGAMAKFKDCFTKKKILFMAVAAALALGVGFGLHWWSEQPGPDAAAYGVSFEFEYEHSAWASPETTAYQENEPIIARGYISKIKTDAPLPNMYSRWDRGKIHPIILVVKDPDGLVYKWENGLSHREYVEQVKLWQTKAHGIHFDFDLQDWVPEGFRWKAGWYIVTGFFSVDGRRLEICGAAFFMKEVPATFRNPPPGTNPATSFAPMLSVGVEADKKAYNTGDIITLRGYLTNISSEPFLVQSRYPFRQGRLMVERGHDFFPNFRYSAPLRLSDFTKVEPGQQILFFEEAFVAGRSDPHWAVGARRACFPPPFARQKYSVWFEMESKGLFPSDRQPDVGIWTGKVKSSSITILINAASPQTGDDSS